MKRYLVILLVLTTILSSCGKHKKGSSETTSGTATTSMAMDADAAGEHFDKVWSYTSSADNLVAKVHATLSLGDESMSTSGTLRMRKDEGIQISLVDPLLGIMELGKLVFTKSEVVVVVRVKKQYGRVPYSQVSFLRKANVSFSSLQALFWHELFEPGATKPDPKSFIFVPENDNVNISYADDMLSYMFVSDKSGLISKTEITGTQDKRFRLWFDYGDFSMFLKKQFPKEISLSFTDGSRITSIKLELSSIKNNSDWELSTTVPNGYEKMDFEKLFNNLMKQ